MTRVARLGAVFTAALVLASLGTGASAQQAPVDVHIRQATLDSDGATEIIVSVTGSQVTGTLPADAFSVEEDGQALSNIEVSPLEQAENPEPRTAIIVFDTSGSTEGDPLTGAKAAADDFVQTVTARGVAVGLVTFADTAQLTVQPTTDAASVTAGIDALSAGGETALFDAMLVAARTLQNLDGQHTIVAFTDGADTVSSADLQAAVNAADTVDATVSAVALSTADLDPAPLQTLATSTGGAVLEAANVDELGAAFSQVARSLTSQYVITYTGGVATGEFDLSVGVTLDGTSASDTVTLLSTRDSTTPTEPKTVTLPDSGVFGSTAALVVALIAAFVALLIFLALILVPRGDRRVTRTLERGLRIYGRRSEDGSQRRAGQTTSSAIGRRAVQFVESLPKPEGYDEAAQLRLDRAGWPLRSSEFTTLRALAVLVGLLVGWGLFGQWILAIILAVAGWIVPNVILSQRVSSRQAKFLGQLPDTLQLLAGSLKAGYGILQGIDTIVKETDEPTATEFQRVLTEARLGLPLEESLEAMADRIGSEDFRWVTVAINIQRRVGGNLAALLETVSETLREREMVRRQISVLSAEGRLSAIILTLLPLVLALYMVIVNPDYIGVLFTRTPGQIMIAGGVVLMVVGIFWMRRLIDIDV